MGTLLPGRRPPRMSRREITLAVKMEREGAEMMERRGIPLDYDIMTYDNRSESYRLPREGNLQVRRAPYEVRPPAHTGVQYSINAEGVFTLSLNNATQLPEYDWNSFKLDTDHHMCQACCDVFNYYCRYKEARLEHYQNQPKEKQNEFALPNAVVHHFNIFSLLAWATIDKCWLCQTLLKNISFKFGRSLHAQNYEDFRTQLCWSQAVIMDQKEILYFVMTDPSKPVDNWNFSHFYRMEAWSVDSLPRHYDPVPGNDLNGIPQLSELSLRDFTSTGSPNSQTIANSWLSQCKNNKDGKHHECNKRDSNYIPTRLLDIRHAQQKSLLRLVCSDITPELFAEDREWMTLSHCWGEWGARENPILVKSNLKERQETGLKVADLPQTFQDAIEIAGWFGINWLWIDCLCIIQDSQEDWLHEAGMMSQIYQNAQLNASADIGADSRAGCFTERDETDITPLQISSPQISKTWMVLPDVTYMFDWMSQATSLSRAWIHRERQLARRVLHFTEGELVWECCGTKGTSFASEMLPGGAPFENGLFNMDHKYQIGRLQQGLMEGDEETYATWNDVCENLSEKDLTKPSDMPMVLSGLAKDFANVLPGDTYIAGLWRSTLPHSLLWNTTRFKEPELEFIAPSWSWLSSGTGVKLANRSNIATKHPIATILNILFPDPETPDFDVKVLEDDDDETDYETWREIGPSWDEFFGEACVLSLDSELEEPILDCWCLFVAFQQWFDSSASRDLSCLLLQDVDGAEETFRRIGTIVFKHTPALKMRYWMTHDLKESMWKDIERIISNRQNKLRPDPNRAGDSEDDTEIEDDAKNVTAGTMVRDAGKQLEVVDALYQFDDIIASKELDKLFDRLEPVKLVIV
ncbi:hypothetical protein ONS95_005048 [Cadophora gregata]|uniref:uncharacterized protein n=1 Tax=Cadophora gregata TaxID=51156 RepID=UPI0026DA84B3|nr:uncharacterized protein ONS95_005048 [Cadophora gregata]KAK0104778.1 hypothetical protein ONS95_005048 [Cadophora gregata]